ncbi:MAG: T9SS type A sorting domain-containing protein, partial [Bacteroidia bacterium]|nr:T9SS type A sorting domain-containing protein [Bacteroidia bacterium]
FVFVFLFFILNSKGQNLVPNGNFETYSTCPTAPSQINLAIPWYDPTGATSDYFNACATVPSFVSVPNGTLGFWQYARSGNAYSGFFAMQNDGSNYREYIQTQFIDSLSLGHCYSVTFYVNLSNLLKKGCNNIGAYISNNPITTSPPNILSYTPQILLAGNPPIIDTVNWIKISGIYNAQGGERFITIGNFQDDSNTDIQLVDSASAYDVAFYYIDDVSVIDCNDTSTSVQENKNDYNFSLYPNPNNGNYKLEYKLKESDDASLFIYDVAGKLIKHYKINTANNQTIIASDNLHNGIYFYKILVNNEMKASDKLIIIK